jgi:hypothetical protein
LLFSSTAEEIDENSSETTFLFVPINERRESLEEERDEDKEKREEVEEEKF